MSDLNFIRTVCHQLKELPNKTYKVNKTHGSHRGNIGFPFDGKAFKAVRFFCDFTCTSRLRKLYV